MSSSPLLPGTKISALPPGDPAQPNDLVPVLRNGSTDFSVTARSLANLAGGFTEGWLIGLSSPPSPNLGINGNGWINSVNGDTYFKVFDTWVKVSNINSTSVKQITGNYQIGNTDGGALLIYNGGGEILAPASPSGSPACSIINNTAAPVNLSGNGHLVEGKDPFILQPATLYQFSENIDSTGFSCQLFYIIVGPDGSYLNMGNAVANLISQEGSALSLGFGFFLFNASQAAGVQCPTSNELQLFGQPITFFNPHTLFKSTVAALPTGAEGQAAYATNGRKTGENAGLGTGVPVYFSNGAWRVYSTDAAVQA